MSPIGMPDLSTEPHLTLPKMESEWVEPQVRGKRFIEGHRVWIMTEDPQWIIPMRIRKEKKIGKGKRDSKNNRRGFGKDIFKGSQIFIEDNFNKFHLWKFRLVIIYSVATISYVLSHIDL